MDVNIDMLLLMNYTPFSRNNKNLLLERGVYLCLEELNIQQKKSMQF